MKIKPEHYAVLETAVKQVLEANPQVTLEAYSQAGLSPMRFRWDALWAARKRSGITIGTTLGSPGCLPLYDYLNDEHIDTALRKITNT